MRDFMDVIRALADESRVRALMALQDRELCVCQIIEMLDLAPSTVSKHMAILKQARLVETRKDGRWIYYRLADEEATPDAREVLECMRRCLRESRQMQQDAETMEAILRFEREDLCRLQSQ